MLLLPRLVITLLISMYIIHPWHALVRRRTLVVILVMVLQLMRMLLLNLLGSCVIICRPTAARRSTDSLIEATLIMHSWRLSGLIWRGRIVHTHMLLLIALLLLPYVSWMLHGFGSRREPRHLHLMMHRHRRMPRTHLMMSMMLSCTKMLRWHHMRMMVRKLLRISLTRGTARIMPTTLMMHIRLVRVVLIIVLHLQIKYVK